VLEEPLELRLVADRPGGHGSALFAREGHAFEDDGICVPLLFIALAAAEADEDAITVHHPVHLGLEEIGWGLVGGVAAGALGAIVLGFVERRQLVAEDWLQVIPLSQRRSRMGSRPLSAAAASSPPSWRAWSSARSRSAQRCTCSTGGSRSTPFSA
jgi:hypothetical protein